MDGNVPARINQESSGKRKTWLWVLGWIFVFPLPLTILLLRKKEMNAVLKYIIIAIAWVLFSLLLLLNMIILIGSSDENGTSNARVTSEKINITEVHFSDPSDVTVNVGNKTTTGTVNVTLRNNFIYSSDDVVFVSDNPEIASIAFVKSSSGKTVYYEISGISPGETFVYATSKDGSILSEKVKVIVPAPVEVESITIEVEKNTLALSETIQASAVVLPANADNQTITWNSSDESVATVNDKGLITAIGGGLATITVQASNGISSSFDLSVDSTKRIMNLRVTHSRDDENNIGDEWSYVTRVNGELTGREITVSVGETLELSAKYTESDDNPDIGEAAKSYIVTEDDILNGFSVSMELYVTENGGKNSGKSAHFIITYAFTVK